MVDWQIYNSCTVVVFGSNLFSAQGFIEIMLPYILTRKYVSLNSLVTYELCHPNHLDGFTFILGTSGVIFNF